jgi:hypothetical protein
MVVDRFHPAQCADRTVIAQAIVLGAERLTTTAAQHAHGSTSLA